MVEESPLEQSWRLSGETSYSRTVERALEAFVNRIKARRILELACSGLWAGDLAEMRDDRPPRIRRVFLVDTSVRIELFRRSSRLDLRAQEPVDRAPL